MESDNKKILILYKSKYGYTKAYAQMLAEEFSCVVCEVGTVSVDEVQGYDIILYGGGLYAGSINGIDWIKRHFDALQTKRIVVWATGLSVGSAPELQRVWKHNLSEDMVGKVHTFYLRGGLDYRKLSCVHKMMMRCLIWILKRKKIRSEEEENLLKSYDTPQDYCDKKNIGELAAYVKTL